MSYLISHFIGQFDANLKHVIVWKFQSVNVIFLLLDAHDNSLLRHSYGMFHLNEGNGQQNLDYGCRV